MNINPAIFKAYDVRGRYPGEINEEAAGIIGQVLAGHFGKGKILIGRDARLSSPVLQKAVLEAFRPAGEKFQVLDIGMVTTPMFYFLVNKLKAAGGVMVTASHNPKDFNGLKIVGPGAQLINGNQVRELVKKHGK